MTTALSDSGLLLASGNIIDLKATMPTTGTYTAGDIVLESTTGAKVSGWKRLTTGSAHVLGTDWVYFAGTALVQSNQTPLPGVATLMSFAHGLGVAPVSAELELVCLTAELGYSVGDVLSNPVTQGSAGYLIPFTIRKTSTVVEARTGGTASFAINHLTTGVTTGLTLANWAWRFKVRAA
jgi:hypothetical protein